MATIRPFRGLRYDQDAAGDIQTLVAPPYDIIYDEWRERLYDRNPYNIIRLIKSKDEPGDTESSNKYTRARADIDAWMEKGILKREDKPVIYVRSDTYTVDGEEYTRFGFISLFRVEDFGDSIHAHERTLSAPKVDRMNLVKATQTNLSQIFTTFEDPGAEVESLLNGVVNAADPDIDFVDEQGITRRLWVVGDMGLIEKLQGLMKNRKAIIADGHHRYETAVAYKKEMEQSRTSPEEPYDYVTMYFSSVDSKGMSILPTHRMIGDLPTFDEDSFFESISDLFTITKFDGASFDDVLDTIAKDADKTNVYGVFTKNGFHIASLRKPSSPKELDVDILHNVIIEEKLGITQEDIAKKRFIHFCKSPDHAYDGVKSGENQISFFMNPVTPEELFRVVLQGRRMPQKSTYFYPKTLSGLVMYRIDRESLG